MRQIRDSKHEGSNAADAHQAYTGADPRAVMVKLLHTVVADSTVGAAGRPPVITGGAPFGLNHKTVDLVLLVCWPASASRHSLVKANYFDACCPLWPMICSCSAVVVARLVKSRACVPVPNLLGWLGFACTACRKAVCCLLASYPRSTQAANKGHVIARLPRRQTGIKMNVSSACKLLCTYSLASGLLPSSLG